MSDFSFLPNDSTLLEGFYGLYGGAFVPETLITPLKELSKAYDTVSQDSDFLQEKALILNDYVGRETPLYYADSLSKYLGNHIRLYLKREDLNHTGAHKINNTVGQILLARFMKKDRIIAETGAGQHGIATATVAAKFGMKCVIYMGEKDMQRQSLNVYRIRLCGAEVIPVSNGEGTLKDAMSEAMRDWVANISDTYYVIGSAAGPAPYPRIVRDFQSVIGDELLKQCRSQWNALPDYLVACLGGGSNAIGFFQAFLNEPSVSLIGVEAAGEGLETDYHAATLSKGKPGVVHGSYSYLLSDEHGQLLDTHSISAGLDYPGIGPEHSFLKDSKRVEYHSATNHEALEAFHLLSKKEGILPALESSHALAFVLQNIAMFNQGSRVVINLSGRGDKDVLTVAQLEGGVS